jgi:type IV pilus assembly protein PilM
MFSLLGAHTLGVDLGASGIKAVAMRVTPTGRITFSCLERPTDSQHRRSAGSRLSARGRFPAGLARRRGNRRRVVAAIPSRDCFLKRLTFPFAQRDKIAQVLAGELEALIPRSVDDLAIRHELLWAQSSAPEPRGGAKHDVLVAAVPQSSVTERLSAFRRAGFRADALHVDALALAELTRWVPRHESMSADHVAVVEIGGSQTKLCASDRGRPWIARTLDWGTERLDEPMPSDDYCVLKDAGEDRDSRRSASSASHRARIEPLINELRIALHGYEAVRRSPVTHILICGDGAGIGQLPERLAQALGLEPLALPMPVRARPGHALAFALAVSAGSVRPWWRSVQPHRIDLLDGLGPTDEVAARRRTLVTVGAGAAVTAAVMTAELALDVALKQRRLEELSAGVRVEFERAFGTPAPATDEPQRARALVADVERVIDVVSEKPSGDLLPRLHDLVRRLPSDLHIVIRSITLDGGVLKVEAETQSFEAVERARQHVGPRPFAIRDVRTGAAPGTVLFVLTDE